MLKTELVNYPLSIRQIDKLIIFMVYYEIETLADLLARSVDENAKLEGWTEDLNSTVEIVREKYPL